MSLLDLRCDEGYGSSNADKRESFHLKVTCLSHLSNTKHNYSQGLSQNWGRHHRDKTLSKGSLTPLLNIRDVFNTNSRTI